MKAIRRISSARGWAIAIAAGFAQSGCSVGDSTVRTAEIRREPTYSGSPRYGAFEIELDDGSEARLWAVFDQSNADSGVYDTLYLDQDLDGDLAEPLSRHTGKMEGLCEDDYPFVRFHVGRLTSDGIGSNYSDAVFTVVKRAGEIGFSLGVVHDRTRRLSCGISSDGASPCSFGDSAATAPVVHALPKRPLSLGLYHYDGSHLLLVPGSSVRIAVMVGVPGSRDDSFTAFDEHYLDLTRDQLWFALDYLDEAGAPASVRAPIQHHCCGILYYDELQVPAKVREPILRLTLHSQERGLSLSKDFPVKISGEN